MRPFVLWSHMTLMLLDFKFFLIYSPHWDLILSTVSSQESVFTTVFCRAKLLWIRLRVAFFFCGCKERYLEGSLTACAFDTHAEIASPPLWAFDLPNHKFRSCLHDKVWNSFLSSRLRVQTLSGWLPANLHTTIAQVDISCLAGHYSYKWEWDLGNMVNEFSPLAVCIAISDTMNDSQCGGWGVI